MYPVPNPFSHVENGDKNIFNWLQRFEKKIFLILESCVEMNEIGILICREKQGFPQGPHMIVFFKVISDFGVSRLFKELSGQYSRCSRIASFCRRDLKQLEVLQRKFITQKIFWQFFGLNEPENQFWKIEFQKKLTSIFQN